MEGIRDAFFPQPKPAPIRHQMNQQNFHTGGGPLYASNNPNDGIFLQDPKKDINDGSSFSLPSMVGHYKYGYGTPYTISQSEFDKMVGALGNDGRFDFSLGLPVNPESGLKGLYYINFSAYGTNYENTIGSGTIYFNSSGVVGYTDYWNFEGQKSGNRPIRGEVKTFIGAALNGFPFWAEYGLIPPVQYRPKH